MPRKSAMCLVLAVIAVMASAGMWVDRKGVTHKSTLALPSRWSEGKTYVYDLFYGSRGEANLPTLVDGRFGASPPTPLATVYKAQLEETVWQRRPGAVDLFVRLTPYARGAPIACLVHLTEAGQAQALTFAEHIGEEDRQIARAILSISQLCGFHGAPHTPWRVEETDLTGAWPATYQLGRPGGGELPFIKRPGCGHTAAGMEVRRRGALHGALALPAGHLLRLTGEVDTEFWHGQHRRAADHVTFNLTLREIRANDGQALKLAAVLADPGIRFAQRSSLAGDEAFEQLRQKTLARTIGSSTLDEVRAAYLRESNGSHAALLPLAAKFEAYLQREPAATADVAVALFAQLRPHDAAYSSLAASLTAVGSPAAQDALRRAMGARGARPDTVQRLVSHLAMVEYPEVASEALLDRLAQSAPDRGVVTSAQLGLGIMGQALLTHDPARAERIFAAAASTFAAGDGSLLSLHVLGNIGHPGQVAVVQTVLAAGPTSLRAPALYSLRFVGTAAARGALVAAAASDDAAEARLAATEALGFQAPTPQVVAAATAQLGRERAAPVLREVLRNLSRWASASPDAAAAVATFARQCSTHDLCAFAEGLQQITR